MAKRVRFPFPQARIQRAKVSEARTCKFCAVGFTVTDTPEEVRWILNVCPACWADDAPGQARFERMQAMMGSQWAIDHA